MISIAELGNFEPDFGRVLAALDFKEPDRVPNFESFIAPNVREAIFGCPLVDGLESELFYRPKLHYDFIYLIPRYKTPPQYSHHNANIADDKREWVDQHANMVLSWEDFYNFTTYPEPDSDPLVLDEVEAAVKAVKTLPGHLGVGVLLPSCPFTEINLVMGYDNFAYALFDNYNLCVKLVDKFGQVGIASAKQLARSHVDFVFFGDDMAYTRGLMVAPEMMRQLFFPYYRKMIGILRDSNKAVIFHSDGDISPLIDDFVDAGLSGLNPIEPLAMDIEKLKEKYYGKLALTGNIDVDLLSVGTPEAVVDMTRQRIETLKTGGGYMLGSGNSICDYVSATNYLTMLKTNQIYGEY